jgi:hypothetical protein
LHAWVGKDNPLGAYSSWNPDVHCGVNGNANQANESTTHAAVDLVCALPE